MNKKLDLLILIIVIALVGCKTAPEQQSMYPFNTASTQQAISPVLSTRWEMVGNPSFSQNGFNLDINGLCLIKQRIVVFYSLSGSSSKKISSDEIFQIVDDAGSISSLFKIIPISNFDQVELGLMVFEPRRTGIHQLFLVMTATSDPNIIQKTNLAYLNGSEFDDFLDRQFCGAPLKSSELAGYQISITGGIPIENKSDVINSGAPAATSTPILDIYPTSTAAVMKPLLPLPPGVIVMNDISFKVENGGNKNVQYYGVVLLSDGNAISVSNGISAWPTPIVLATPETPDLTYPPPPPYP